MMAPRGTPYSDPILNSLKDKQLGRGQQIKIAPQDGFAQVQLYLWGAHPNPEPDGSTLSQEKKLLYWVALPGINLFLGGLPQTWAPRVHPNKWGFML
jgi:hypothetical protein